MIWVLFGKYWSTWYKSAVLSPIFEQKLEFFHSVWFLIKNTEARRAEEVKAFELAFMKVSYNRNAILPMFMSNGMPINGRHSWTLNDALMKRIACATRLINFLPQSFLDLNFAPRFYQNFFLPPSKNAKNFSLGRETVWGLGMIFENGISSISDPLVCGLRRPKALVFGGLAASLVIRDYWKDPFPNATVKDWDNKVRKIPHFPNFPFLHRWTLLWRHQQRFLFCRLTVLFLPKCLMVQNRRDFPPSAVVTFRPPWPVSGSIIVSKNGCCKLEPFGWAAP